MPKTIGGAIVWALGWIGASGLFNADFSPVLHAVSEVLIAIGGVVTAIGVWHGNIKVQAKLAQLPPPRTVGDAFQMRRDGQVK